MSGNFTNKLKNETPQLDTIFSLDDNSSGSLNSNQEQFLQAKPYFQDDSLPAEPVRKARRFSRSSVASDTSMTTTLSKKITNIVDVIRADNEITTEELKNKIDLEIPDVLDQVMNMDDDVTSVKNLDAKIEKNFQKGIELASIKNGEPALQDVEKEPTSGSQASSELDSEVDDEGPTDGGYGWVCCICFLFLSVSTWGANASYGIFLAYYINADYFPGATSTDFSFIGGIVVGVSQIIAPLVLILSQFWGMKICIGLGIVLQCIAYITAAWCKEIWQLYLTQGVLTSISFALVFYPSLTVLPGWFLKKRGLAGGIGLSGSGLGGIIFGLATDRLLQQTGNQKWPLIMLGITTTFSCTICLILIKERKKPVKGGNISNAVKSVLDLSVIKSLPVNIISLNYAITSLGYTVLLFSLSAYGTAVAGLTTKQASNLTVIINLGQFIGRPTIGFVADRVGRINFSILGGVVTTILVFAFWLNAKTYATLIAFGLVGGLFMGVSNVLYQTLASDAVNPSQIPAAFSQVSILAGFTSLFAEVIGQNMVDNTRTNPYLYCQIFSGLCYLVGALVLLPLREMKIKRMITARRDALQAQLGEEEAREDEDKDVKRLDTYDILLGDGISAYCIRSLYPIVA